MPLYRFKIADSTGTVSEMLTEGNSQSDAARRLQRRGIVPLAFLGEGTAVAEKRQGHFTRKFNVVEFTERLVPLLEAEIPLERALGIVGDDPDNPALASTSQDLRRGLHEGRKLSELVRERGRVFPPLYAGVVEAGEEAGALPQVMGELRRFLNESEELASFILSSSIYPAFISVSGLAMFAFILMVIVPRFAAALVGAGVRSTSTEILLAMSSFLRSYWWTALVAAGLAIYVIMQIRKPGSRLSRLYDELVLKVPLIGRLVLYSNIARLCRTMSILMRSGVHLLNTVSIANRVVQNHSISSSIAGVAGDLRQGQKLSSALSQSRYIPSLMLKMIAVGEETGSVETMLERVADRYETDMRRSIKRLLSVFEPVIIVVLGLSVGFIVLLMFMSMMDMQGAAK